MFKGVSERTFRLRELGDGGMAMVRGKERQLGMGERPWLGIY
jgi:hypothetical protein